METFLKDLRYGSRGLAKNPGFTAVAVITLALGIGANTAIFSVVYNILLRPLPYAQPDRLVWVWESQPQLQRAPFTPADFLDYQAQNQSFEGLAAYFNAGPTMTGDGQPERVDGWIVSANFFSLLRVAAAHGRVFQPDDGEPGAARVAVISHAFWQRRFGGDAEVLGRTLVFNSVPFTVVGVVPADFKFMRTVDVWLNPRNSVPEPNPASARDVRPHRGNHYLSVFGRLRDGVTLEQTQSDLENISAGLQQQHNSNHGVRAISLHERIVGNMRLMLLVLLGAVGLVLLITCANVANLLLSRARARSREIAIRAALGAGRLRIIRQLLTESLLLAIVGGAVGLLVGLGGVSLIVFVSPQNTPRLAQVSLDTGSLVFTLAVSVATGLVFGLVPSLQASKTNLNEALKEGGRTGSGRSRLRSALVAVEIALSLVVLVGAGLLVRSFIRLLDVPPGFKTENLTAMSLSLTGAKYTEDERIVSFYRQLLPRLQSIAGIESASIAYDLPIRGSFTTRTFVIEGREERTGEELLAGYHPISPNYFEAMGITLLRGRALADSDSENSAQVIVINETLARQLFAEEDPIGKRVRFGPPDNPWVEIVGIVNDVKHNGLDAEASLETYVPFPQQPTQLLTLMLRSSIDTASLAAAVRSEALALDGDLPVFDVRNMEKFIGESVASQRFSMSLTALFAMLALALASVGIYGVMAYSVTQRAHEIGIRMALGAKTSDVLRLVVRQGLMLTLAGVGAGLAGAFVLTRWMTNMLFEVSATDTLTFVVVSLLLAAVAVLACYVPARRAARVDPVIALRYE